MPTPGTVVCPTGAVPAAGNLASDLIWLGTQFIAVSDLAELTRVNPGLAGQLVARLTNVGTLCSSNPVYPEPMTVDDVLAAIVDPLVGPVLPESYAQKLADLITYTAFQAKCVCNASPGVCQPVSINTSLGVDLEYNSNFPGFGWPTTNPGAHAAADWAYAYYPWNMGCANLDFWFNEIGNAGSTAHNPVRLASCGPVNNYNQSNIENNWIQTTMTTGTCASGGPGIHIAFAYNVTPSAHPNWRFQIRPHSGTTPVITPPAPGAPATTSIPTAPTLDCSAATQCSVIWNILQRIQIDIGRNPQTIDAIQAATPSNYVLGTAHTLTGQGEQAVAAGTLGLLLNIVAVPDYQQSRPTEPQSYYDVGWVALGSADGVYPKRWLRFNGEILLPDFPVFTRFAYNCGFDVTLQATELMPAPA